MVRLSAILQQWGERRPQAKDLRYPPEFPPGPERDAAEMREEAKPTLFKARDWYVRTVFQSWNTYHGKRRQSRWRLPKTISSRYRRPRRR